MTGFMLIGAFGLTVISEFLLKYQNVINLAGGLLLYMGLHFIFGKKEAHEIPIILIASKEQQEAEQDYYQNALGLVSEYIFAENNEETGLLVVGKRFIFTNKLTNFFLKKEEDIRPFFEQQLEDCGVKYFGYYLMHAQGVDNFRFFKNYNAYETAFALKEEGKVKHVGISFHDKADVFLQNTHRLKWFRYSLTMWIMTIRRQRAGSVMKSAESTGNQLL